MRLMTIVTLPAATPAEKWDRFKEWTVQQIAWHLPKRVMYWAVVRAAVSVTDGNPSDLTVMDVMERMDGKYPEVAE